MRMKPAKAAFCSAAFLLASSAFVAPAQAQERVVIGNAASVVGDVTLDNDQLRRPIEVRRRQRIAWDDLIRTRRNSQLQILLLDRSSMTIPSDATVRIDRYDYDPNEGRSLFTTLLKGALRFFSGSSDGNNTAEVSTPAGRIGIRGTAIDILVGEEAEDIAEDEDFVGRVRSDDDEATFVVLRGPSENALSGLTPGLADVTSGGVTVTLDQPGAAAYIPRAGVPPIGPFQISNAGLASVQNEMAPRWARSFGRGGIPDEVLIGAAAAAIFGLIVVTNDDDDDQNGTSTGDAPPTQGTEPANPDGQTSQDNCEDANGRPIPCPIVID